MVVAIDGSYLEGGGQILRTSLSLSAIFGEPFKIKNIRANRPKKGLMHQHLAGVNAVAEITNATVSGNALHSTEVSFSPSGIFGGSHVFDIGTAGSAILLLQAVIPPLLHNKRHSSITAIGGTHVMKSPTYEYFSECFLNNAGLFGAEIKSTMLKPGFYPKGGGKVKVDISPSTLHPREFTSRGALKSVKAYLISSKIPKHVCEREAKYILEHLEGVGVDIKQCESQSPGNSVTIVTKYQNYSISTDELGRIGKPAEKVAEDAVAEIMHLMDGKGPDNHMVDQLMLYFALAGKGSMRYSSLTNHARTNMYTISKFTGKEFYIDEESKTIHYE